MVPDPWHGSDWNTVVVIAGDVAAWTIVFAVFVYWVVKAVRISVTFFVQMIRKSCHTQNSN